MTKKITSIFLVGTVFVLLFAAWILREGPGGAPARTPPSFDGSRAMEDVEFQVSLGPRTPGSTAHAQAVDWMVQELRDVGWKVEIQETERMGHPIRNVIARYGEGEDWLILGAHYDSRLVANQDPQPENRNKPVPGANDGASGVAVLLEMARVLPENLASTAKNGASEAKYQQIWLVFFDAEDNGSLPGWDWILGSRAFVDSLETKPDAAVIVDMIGDENLNVYKEKNSDPELTDEIWQVAGQLGYEESIIPEYKYRISDDHIPFIESGIPAVDMIDFDYPYWHTVEDTVDKVSANSLDIIGETLLAWITQSTTMSRSSN